MPLSFSDVYKRQAFFYRGRDVAVLGSGEYALHEVQALLPVAHSVTLLTGGAPLTAQFPPEVAVRTEVVDVYKRQVHR